MLHCDGHCCANDNTVTNDVASFIAYTTHISTSPTLNGTRIMISSRESKNVKLKVVIISPSIKQLVSQL